MGTYTGLDYFLADVKKESERALFNVVSTFAGVGGSSTGYRLAGGRVLAINEFIPKAYEAYARNYPDTPIFTQDIRELTGKEILDKIGLKRGELDILDGSPPCSSFSVCGSRDYRKEGVKKYSDTKQQTNDLFFEFGRLVEELQPKVFISENVPGLTKGVASNLLGSSQYSLFDNNKNTIFHFLAGKGYYVRYKVLDASEFGVPQSRERLFIIGVRKDIDRPLSYPIGETDKIPLREAFASLDAPIEPETDIRKYAIYEASVNTPLGKNSERYFNLIKLSPDRVAFTLTQTASQLSAASVVHWENRKLSVAEAGRVQSFPVDYYYGETYSDCIERIGRSVPPLLMRAIAEHIYNTILK